MKINQNILSYIFVGIFFMCVICGIACNIRYNQSPQKPLPVKDFQEQMINKDHKALRTVNSLKEMIKYQPLESLNNYPFGDDEISYYIFQTDRLIFWSDNQLAVNNIELLPDKDVSLVKLPNAYCVARKIQNEDISILALIKIKNDYRHENKYLNNEFVKGFEIDKQIEILVNDPNDRNAIFSSDSQYLFSLSAPKQGVYNDKWSHICLIFYISAFIILFVIYARFPILLKKNQISFKEFGFVSLCLGILLSVALYFDIPELFFSNKLFSPMLYASNSFFSSIAHLSIFSFYVLSTTYLLYFFVDKTYLDSIVSKTIAQLIYILFFTFFYYILHTIVYDSNLQVIILAINDFSVFSIWFHILILVGGFALALLFFSTHQKPENCPLKKTITIDISFFIILALFSLLFTNHYYESILYFISFIFISTAFYFLYFSKQNNYKKIFVALSVFIFTMSIALNLSIFSIEKKHNKFRILAQNIIINGNVDGTNMTDLLIEELDFMLVKDNKINRLILQSDTIEHAQEYINNTYLRGFWNRYEMKLNKMYQGSDEFISYNEYAESIALRVNNTHFYAIPPSKADVAYIGIIPIYDNDSTYYSVELYPKRHFRSYSFPDLLIPASAETDKNTDISIAKYENGILTYDSGDINYPADIKWIPESEEIFFTAENKNFIHHIYQSEDDSYIIITELKQHDFGSYFLYYLYLFVAFLSVVWFVRWIYNLSRSKKELKIGLIQKFQYSFVALLFIGFFSTFYVSINFIRKKYQDEQIQKLEDKRNYIQNELQSKYYWNEFLHQDDRQILNFDLQEISYTYHIDIHVYDNNGILIGSSQPLLFNRNLISEYITPKVFFSESADINQYEHIGNLQYLSAYTDFYNGDFLQIGYIAVPQFFSLEEAQKETEDYVSVIIHIYFLIIIISLIISLIIGKQLSAPLMMLENKLRNMQLGKRNEKIEYYQNDEIKQLVDQYNLTVDELEKSAMLLAKSERETAWKSMARQVAHEINNPLTPMKLTIQQLQRTKGSAREVFDDYFEKSTQTLIEQIDNLSRIAGTFSDFARMPEPKFVKTDIASRLCSAIQLFKSNYTVADISYDGPTENIFVNVDPEQWLQVFNNLLKNAIQAIPKNKEKIIQSKLYVEDELVFIEISDNGTGINDDTAKKLFAPNFTTKNTGMGLGLAISKNIIETSGGTISFKTKINEGTTFTIKIPKL